MTGWSAKYRSAAATRRSRPATRTVRGVAMPWLSSAAYCRTLLISRLRAPGTFTTRPARPARDAGAAMVPRVRRRAHAVVEHAVRRGCSQVEGARIEEPLGPGQSALFEGVGQRRQPGGILMEDVDTAHDRILPGIAGTAGPG